MLRVNSFPRTANMFTSRMLVEFFDVKSTEYTSKEMHDKDLLSDTTMSQIVIIRDPKDCIPSFEILKKLVDKENYDSIERSSWEWIQWHQSVIKNSNHLFLFSFEEITNNPIDCLVAVADINKISHRSKEEIKEYFKSSMYRNNKIVDTVKGSSKNSNDYKDKVKKYHEQDPKILKLLDNLYIEIKKTIDINQKNHGIKIEKVEI
jgi:hypothetical protein